MALNNFQKRLSTFVQFAGYGRNVLWYKDLFHRRRSQQKFSNTNIFQTVVWSVLF